MKLEKILKHAKNDSSVMPNFRNVGRAIINLIYCNICSPRAIIQDLIYSVAVGYYQLQNLIKKPLRPRLSKT